MSFFSSGTPNQINNENNTAQDAQTKKDAKLLQHMVKEIMKKEMKRYEKEATNRAEIIFQEKYNLLERSINDTLKKAQLYHTDNDLSITSEYPNPAVGSNNSATRMVAYDAANSQRNKNHDLVSVEDGSNSLYRFPSPSSADANFGDTFNEDDNHLHTTSGNRETTFTNDSKDDTVEVSLPPDSYSIMMTSDPFSSPWLFAFGVFLLQAGLFVVVLLAQLEGALRNIPINPPTFVLVGQALALLVVFFIQVHAYTQFHKCFTIIQIQYLIFIHAPSFYLHL